MGAPAEELPAGEGAVGAGGNKLPRMVLLRRGVGICKRWPHPGQLILAPPLPSGASRTTPHVGQRKRIICWPSIVVPSSPFPSQKPPALLATRPRDPPDAMTI